MEESINILLCCAGGMSSGFLASKMRKAGKKQGLNLQVQAVAESNVGTAIKDYHVLLVGPHYTSQLESFQRICEPYGVPVAIIPKDIYGMLDGDGAVALALKTLGK